MSAPWSEERIVTEVLRRLRAVASADAPAPTSNAPAPAVPAPPDPPGRLTLDQPLVTLATIAGRLTGVRQFVVRPRAVVTPAVRDELRSRGITLLRAARPVTPATRPLCLGSTGHPAAQHAADWCGARVVDGTELRTLLTRLAGAIAGGAAAILLCERASLATALGCRLGMRAAAVRTSLDAERAAEELGAELLVVPPLGLTPRQLAAIAVIARRPLRTPPDWAAT